MVSDKDSSRHLPSVRCFPFSRLFPSAAIILPSTTLSPLTHLLNLHSLSPPLPPSHPLTHSPSTFDFTIPVSPSTDEVSKDEFENDVAIATFLGQDLCTGQGKFAGGSVRQFLNGYWTDLEMKVIPHGSAGEPNLAYCNGYPGQQQLEGVGVVGANGSSGAVVL